MSHITFTCGHERTMDDMSACQKGFLERYGICPACQYHRTLRVRSAYADQYGWEHASDIRMPDCVAEDMRQHPELYPVHAVAEAA